MSSSPKILVLGATGYIAGKSGPVSTQERMPPIEDSMSLTMYSSQRV